MAVYNVQHPPALTDSAFVHGAVESETRRSYKEDILMCMNKSVGLIGSEGCFVRDSVCLRGDISHPLCHIHPDDGKQMCIHLQINLHHSAKEWRQTSYRFQTCSRYFQTAGLGHDKIFMRVTHLSWNLPTHFSSLLTCSQGKKVRFRRSPSIPGSWQWAQANRLCNHRVNSPAR